MRNNLPTLWQRSAASWLGSFFAAEGILGWVIWLLSDAVDKVVINVAFGSLLGALATFALVVGWGIAISFIAHKIELKRDNR